MRPQLQTTGADAEHTGEEPVGLKELWDMEVLRQGWELFTQIGRFLRGGNRINFVIWRGLVGLFYVGAFRGV